MPKLLYNCNLNVLGIWTVELDKTSNLETSTWAFLATRWFRLECMILSGSGFECSASVTLCVLVLRSSHTRATTPPFPLSLSTCCPLPPSLGCHGSRKLRRCTGHMGGSEPYGRVVSKHIWNIWPLVLACQLLSSFDCRLPLILLTVSFLALTASTCAIRVLCTRTNTQRLKKKWDNWAEGNSLVSLPIGCWTLVSSHPFVSSLRQCQPLV